MANPSTSRTTRLIALRFFVAVIGACVCWPAADAAQFRQLKKIRTPVQQQETVDELRNKGYSPVGTPVPVPRRLAARQIETLVGAWNTVRLERYLADGFFDKQRLLDTIREDVPHDARLRILGVQSVDTLDQHQKGLGGDRFLVTSTVSARLRMQIEFNDPRARGNQVIRTLGDYIFRVRLQVRKRTRQTEVQ